MAGGTLRRQLEGSGEIDLGCMKWVMDGLGGWGLRCWLMGAFEGFNHSCLGGLVALAS
jgi:hypothetical protein